MKNDLNITSVRDYGTTIKDFVVRYRFVLFITIVSLIIGFMFIRIASMSTSEPTEAQITEAEKVEVVKMSDDSVLVIQQLVDRNISIEALFDPGRYDPFND